MKVDPDTKRTGPFAKCLIIFYFSRGMVSNKPKRTEIDRNNNTSLSVCLNAVIFYLRSL